MSFLLHELVAQYFSLKHPGLYKVGLEKDEKDIHCLKDTKYSIEIKASSDPKKIFANRSYAQPQTGKGQKSKDGYYITINFEKFKNAKNRTPKILLIRFGYLDHSDWIGQKAQTGQRAHLSANVYKYKLNTIYDSTKTK